MNPYDNLQLLRGYDFTVAQWKEHLRDLARRGEWTMLTHYLKQIETAGTLHRLEGVDLLA